MSPQTERDLPPTHPPTTRPLPLAVQDKENMRISTPETVKDTTKAPRRGLLRLRRLSERSMSKIGKKREQPAKSKSTPSIKRNIEDAHLHRDEEDPVVALFEARSKQRVRFCLEGSVEESKNKGTVEPTKGSDETIAAIASESTFNIKKFMGRILFNKASAASSTKQLLEPGDELDDEEKEEIGRTPLVWESNEVEEESPDVVHTTNSPTKGKLKMAFTEKPDVRSKVAKLLDKARRAQFSHYRYRYAVKCYVKANEILSEAKYPHEHSLCVRTLRALSNAHHALSCFDNSANIVKMGIKYEESGELIRALKMYTIAYRIRRDQISRTHPSLVVLLNILGSIQVKRGELKEAMQIYELALRDAPAIVPMQDDDDDEISLHIPSSNLLARAVTFREMGIICEKLDNPTRALHRYHRSLESISEWRDRTGAKYRKPAAKSPPSQLATEKLGCSLDRIQLGKAITKSEHGEMELFITDRKQLIGSSGDSSVTAFYDSFFPGVKESTSKKRKKQLPPPTGRDAYADVDVSLTLHQIAQLHRRQGQFGRSLEAYRASLRGMKHALGDIHPNVAAILGNIGNLQKELGDLDAAYETYQDVLGIESYRLGVSHPEVAISLHNVATIEAARGNYELALSIYQKVLNLQRKLFGSDHLAVAITSASMGDVYERLGDMILAIDCYEESLRAKTAVCGRHDLQVGRILHKLGKMAFIQKDYNLANSHISRAILIYRLNKITDEHEWLVDTERDSADINAAIALGSGRFFEC